MLILICPVETQNPQLLVQYAWEDEGIVTKKFESWELFEHLESKKHTKSNLASFFAYEAVSNQFWEDE